MKYIFLFSLLLVINVAKGQKAIAKNQLRYIYNQDTVIHTFDRDVIGKQKYVLFKSQNDDDIKASTIICFYDDIGILDKLGGSLMGVEKNKGGYFYFSSPIKISNKQDSLYFSVNERYLNKSLRKAIARMNTGKNADGFSDSEMIFSGKITPEYLYLTCEGEGCVRKLFIFKKSYESEIKSTRR
jgi:hypothetical protein